MNLKNKRTAEFFPEFCFVFGVCGISELAVIFLMAYDSSVPHSIGFVRISRAFGLTL
jgi:hypothetical protein